LTARAPIETNRAGLTLLHPVAGVSGEAVTVTRPDGAEAEARFPMAISPGQPVFDIAGLRHVVSGVAVDIRFAGEVFEMEDQRNWSDASYKTYCRPLAAPRPYVVAAGETVRQSVVIRLSGAPAAATAAASGSDSSAPPEVALAADAAWDMAESAALIDAVPDASILLRVALDEAAAALSPAAFSALKRPVDLELVTADDGDVAAAMAACAARMAAAGLRPRSVIATPRAYMASHQPEGPWPAGLSPRDAAIIAGRAFEGAAVGVGMLTNFTEFNRRPPPQDVGDHVAYSTTAIVHAADDRSVLETLEALPQIHASARALAGGRPIRLGLASIGMRTNPYGAAVAPNPGLARVAMATDDPRQRTVFAAAFAVGAYAAAAREGCARIALAGVGGPFAMGAVEDGRVVAWPILHAVKALSMLSSGDPVDGPAVGPGLLGVAARRPDGTMLGVYANCTLEPAELRAPGAVAKLLGPETDASSVDWLDHAPERAADTLPLAPLSVAFLSWRAS
jgi:hypothetical protein